MGGQGGHQTRTMSDEITVIKSAESTPVKTVVEALETSLEDAKSGRLRNVVIVGDLTGNLTFCMCGMDDRIRLLGYLDMAKWNVLSS